MTHPLLNTARGRVLPVVAGSALVIALLAPYANGSPGELGLATPTKSFAGNYLAGRHAQHQHDTLSASALLGAASQLAPDNDDLLRRTYVLALSEGRIPDAVNMLLQLKRLGKTAPLADIVWAVDDIKNGRYKTVQSEFDESPTGISAFLAPTIRAWGRVGEKDLAGALKAVGDLDQQRGGLAFMHMNLGLLHDLAGNAAAAELHFLEAEKESGRSLRLAQFLGGLYERSGDPKKAMAIYSGYDTAAETDTLSSPARQRIASGIKPPREVSTPSEGVAEALFSLSSSLANQTIGESAAAMAQLALYLRPGFAPAMAIIASTLEGYGQREQANQIYSQIPKSDVMSWSARLKVAENLDRLDQQAAATSILLALAEERPLEARPLIELGDILRRHEDFPGAADAYSRALKRLPAIEDKHWAILYSRGIAYERSRRWPEAEADFLEALKLQPDQPLVLNYLGYSWIDQGVNLTRALDMIKKAVSLRPRDGYVVDSLGWGLYRMGDYEDATKYMERAVLLNPQDPIINDHLGDVLWQVGRKREARFQWKRAIGMEPEPDVIKVIEQKLKNGLPARP